MDSRFDFGPETGRRIAYVRPVSVAELPAELRAQAGPLEIVYAVHDGEGQRLALVADRKLAFFLARQHDLAPVSVH